jgi:hypothetical protein
MCTFGVRALELGTTALDDESWVLQELVSVTVIRNMSTYNVFLRKYYILSKNINATFNNLNYFY